MSMLRLAHSDEDDENSTETVQDLVKKLIDPIVDNAAKERNLEKIVFLERIPPIDIFVFGRSGIGKSELIKAITGTDIETSAKLDHVTETLTESIVTIGSLQFRFWDTKGIDNWLDIDVITNLFQQMKQRGIRPLFVIYCSAAGGRVDSGIVANILENFRKENILICYVITNIYAGTDEQLEQQIEGGRAIMKCVFQTVADTVGEYNYQYQGTNDDFGSPSQYKKPGLLIGINSRTFTNRMGSMPPINIDVLMKFIGDNLSGEDFTKFVALTLNNRNFWNRFYDSFRTKIIRASNSLGKISQQANTFFEWLFKTKSH